MLRAPGSPALTEQDQTIFTALISPDHLLRQVAALIDFDSFRPLLATRYHATTGRPAYDPIVLLKLGYLQFHYTLSDRAVVAMAHVNVAFRYFLNLALHDPVPHPSLLAVFRKRLGDVVYQQVFDGVVAQARAAGLVHDAVRLKDATHVLADVAIPRAVQLVAQARQRLLTTLRPFAAARVAAEEAHALALRTRTQKQPPVERLQERVTHLHAIVTWADALVSPWTPFPEPLSPAQLAVIEALALAHKILLDRAHLDNGDLLRSLVDPDVRRGHHGDYFDGYLLDVALDADSQLITALDVLPANGDEAANATALLAHEEQVHGNDIHTLSMDKAGFRGSLLRTWTDPAGLRLQVVVPPTAVEANPGFSAEQFVHDAEAGTLKCPTGVTATQRIRNRVKTGWKYIFPRSSCATCALQTECMERLPKANGRVVIVNDYAAEYAAARTVATTAFYRQVRRVHPTIERKLGEIVRRHAGRRTRYRGRSRVRIQYLLTGVVVNIKRMVRLRTQPSEPDPPCRGHASGHAHPANAP